MGEGQLQAGSEGGAKKNKNIGQGAAGCTSWMVAKVKLKPGEQEPISVIPRMMNPKYEELLQNQLKLWLRQGMSETTQSSEWLSALVMVTKNDKSKTFLL